MYNLLSFNSNMNKHTCRTWCLLLGLLFSIKQVIYHYIIYEELKQMNKQARCHKIQKLNGLKLVHIFNLKKIIDTRLAKSNKNIYHVSNITISLSLNRSKIIFSIVLYKLIGERLITIMPYSSTPTSFVWKAGCSGQHTP